MNTTHMKTKQSKKITNLVSDIEYYKSTQEDVLKRLVHDMDLYKFYTEKLIGAQDKLIKVLGSKVEE